MIWRTHTWLKPHTKNSLRVRRIPSRSMKWSAGLAWKIEFTPKAEKDLKKLGKAESRRVVSFLRQRVALNPKELGGQLKGQLREFWRYRVGDYRVLATIRDEHLLVLVVRIRHRKDVY